MTYDDFLDLSEYIGTTKATKIYREEIENERTENN